MEEKSKKAYLWVREPGQHGISLFEFKKKKNLGTRMICKQRKIESLTNTEKKKWSSRETLLAIEHLI